MRKQWLTLFLRDPKSLQMLIAAMKLKGTYSLEGKSWPASFCTPMPNLPVTPGISWLPIFVFQSPMMKRTSFWMLVLKGVVGLHRTIQFQLLHHYKLGHRLGLLWHWMVCLGNKQRSCLYFCKMLLCTCPKKFKTYGPTKIYTQMFIAALFMTVKIWKHQHGIQ